MTTTARTYPTAADVKAAYDKTGLVPARRKYVHRNRDGALCGCGQAALAIAVAVVDLDEFDDVPSACVSLTIYEWAAGKWGGDWAWGFREGFDGKGIPILSVDVTMQARDGWEVGAEAARLCGLEK